MSDYNQYYLSKNLFGAPYPELVSYFDTCKTGSVLDLGCGQGRDALFLADLGFKVTAVDNSKLGIAQMLDESKRQGLELKGLVADIYEWDDFNSFDYVLLDSMFHFLKEDRAKELAFIHKIFDGLKTNAAVVFCIPDNGDKVSILENAIAENQKLVTIAKVPFIYTFNDDETGQSTEMDYNLISVQK
ncbi:MAG: methyltransferase domain-containing protein [Crocinitomix sp.]|nr:methyltransferase domain-containing protein [Crocinitomix sp.]